MEIDGLVQNGVVVLTGGLVLPEGMHVTISCSPQKKQGTKQRQRIVLPLVPSKTPGTLDLTADRVADLLEDADVPA